MKRTKCFQTHSVRPALPWDQNQIKTIQRKKKEERKITGHNTDEHRCKNSQQTKCNNTLKRSYDIIKWNLLQGCESGQYPQIINVIHINKMRDKNHTIISIDSEKAFNKTHLNKVGIEGTYLNIIKVIYDKPTSIIVNSEKLKLFL